MGISKSEAKLTEPFVGKKEVIVMLSVQDGQSTASATKLDYDAVHALEQMIIDLTFIADTPQTERMTEEEIDTMLAKVLVGQTDWIEDGVPSTYCNTCDYDRLNGKSLACDGCEIVNGRPTSYKPITDCGWGEPK